MGGARSKDIVQENKKEQTISTPNQSPEKCVCHHSVNCKAPIFKSDIEEFRATFELYGVKEGHGISARDLGTAMRCLGRLPTDDDLRTLIGQTEMDQHGCMNCDQFVDIMIQYQRNIDPEKVMREAFRVFDKNGSGIISVDLLRHVMQSGGEKLNDREMTELMKEAGINDKRFVNYNVLIKLLCSDPPGPEIVIIPDTTNVELRCKRDPTSAWGRFSSFFSSIH